MALQAPVGTSDLLPEESLFWDKFKKTAFEVFGRYGYLPIETPLIERTDLFVRGIGEATDVVSKEMYTAISGENLKTLIGGGHIKSSSRLSLRPEGTAGVVRAAVQHDLVPQGAAPAKLVYAGSMFRAERPQQGRKRQFNQVGIECLGAEAPSVDAEGIIMLMRFFETIGIPYQSMHLLINSMGCEHCRPAFREAVRDFLAAHVDELCDDCKHRMETNPLRAFDCKNEHCAALMASAPRITDYLCEECKEHYETVKSYLNAADITYIEDTTLVRGLDYYTRTVFEVQVPEGTGAQTAIGGGGRYDKLVEEVGGRPTPGFGFALGYERCVLALQAAGLEFPKPQRCEIFIACVDDSTRAAAFTMVQGLRDVGLKAELDHQGRSLKSQFKLADKLGARLVATLGPEEMETGIITVRNMVNHRERKVDWAKMKALLLHFGGKPFEGQTATVAEIFGTFDEE